MTKLTTVPEELEIDTAMTTLLVVDMQNGCASPGGMFDAYGLDISRARRAVPVMQTVIQAYRRLNRPVVYIAHRFSPDFRELGDPASPLWKRTMALKLYRERPEIRNTLLVRGMWGAEIIDELKPQTGDITVEKSRYTAFWGTNLDAILKSLRSRYLLICGVQTNQCVEGTFRDAFYNGYHPILVEDACAAASDGQHNAAVSNMRGYGWGTTAADIIKALA